MYVCVRILKSSGVSNPIWYPENTSAKHSLFFIVCSGYVSVEANSSHRTHLRITAKHLLCDLSFNKGLLKKTRNF